MLFIAKKNGEKSYEEVSRLVLIVVEFFVEYAVSYRALLPPKGLGLAFSKGAI